MAGSWTAARKGAACALAAAQAVLDVDFHHGNGTPTCF
jgi:acetoin utilization deacetylase AcuC-like enzyme